jgi:hypothetical protein
MYCIISDKQEKIRERVLEEANYIIDNNCSIRYASDNLMTPKSTIHKDMRYRLSDYD